MKLYNVPADSLTLTRAGMIKFGRWPLGIWRREYNVYTAYLPGGITVTAFNCRCLKSTISRFAERCGIEY